MFRALPCIPPIGPITDSVRDDGLGSSVPGSARCTGNSVRHRVFRGIRFRAVVRWRVPRMDVTCEQGMKVWRPS